MGGAPATGSGAASSTAGAAGDDVFPAGAAGGDSAPTCAFTVSSALSSSIQTVGIVEWSSDLAAIQSASIEFGLDESYGQRAPVDLTAPNHHTLLLGMKPSRTYHFRIAVQGDSVSCKSRDFLLTTGPVANGLPGVSLTDHGGPSAGGFFLSSFLTSGPAFVLDADGDYVWSYGTGEMGRAALTHDGKYLWYAAVNVAGGAPSMKRVTLDGLEETDFTADFGEIHHDFTLLPDDTIAFLQHDGDSDRVMERAPDGSVSEVFAVGAALGETHTHANSLHYFAGDDTYTVSELATSSFIKVTRAGDVVWILGGTHGDFTGDGASWENQHGHQVLAADRLLFFSNGPADGDSTALEVKLDLANMTATRTWQYEPGQHCLIFGDVERLANANTLVTFSTLGLVHEVTADGQLVRELTWDLGGALGYATHLGSLYPPY
jgi:Arylsulfotransferase (ASST)